LPLFHNGNAAQLFAPDRRLKRFSATMPQRVESITPAERGGQVCFGWKYPLAARTQLQFVVWHCGRGRYCCDIRLDVAKSQASPHGGNPTETRPLACARGGTCTRLSVRHKGGDCRW
jgi:hypothetical protein